MVDYFGNHIHILDENSDVWSTIKEIVLSKQEEDPFFVCNVAELVRRYEMWIAAMPRIKTNYVVKCNNNRIVLKVFAALGTDFDCFTPEEISQVLSVGVSPQRIIFTNPAKPKSFIKFASKMGVNRLVFDSEMELYKMKELYENAKLVVRIKYDDEGASIVLGKKFGCDPKCEALRLLRLAKTLNLNVVGVSFHVGCSTKNVSIFAEAIAASKQLFDFASSIGYKFDLLDIGGGYPGETGTNLNEISKFVNSALQKYFPDSSIEVHAEPGRYYVNSAFFYVCHVNLVKELKDNESNLLSQMVYVSGGIYSGLMNVMINEKYYPKPLFDKGASKKYPCAIWGCTADSLDKITEDELPIMDYGDWIVFRDTGAYSITLVTNFNGYSTPKIASIVDKNTWLKIGDKLQNNTHSTG